MKRSINNVKKNSVRKFNSKNEAIMNNIANVLSSLEVRVKANYTRKYNTFVLLNILDTLHDFFEGERGPNSQCSSLQQEVKIAVKNKAFDDNPWELMKKLYSYEMGYTEVINTFLGSSLEIEKTIHGRMLAIISESLKNERNTEKRALLENLQKYNGINTRAKFGITKAKHFSWYLLLFHYFLRTKPKDIVKTKSSLVLSNFGQFNTDYTIMLKKNELEKYLKSTNSYFCIDALGAGGNIEGSNLGQVNLKPNLIVTPAQIFDAAPTRGLTQGKSIDLLLKRDLIDVNGILTNFVQNNLKGKVNKNMHDDTLSRVNFEEYTLYYQGSNSQIDLTFHYGVYIKNSYLNTKVNERQEYLSNSSYVLFKNTTYSEIERNFIFVMCTLDKNNTLQNRFLNGFVILSKDLMTITDELYELDTSTHYNWRPTKNYILRNKFQGLGVNELISLYSLYTNEIIKEVFNANYATNFVVYEKSQLLRYIFDYKRVLDNYQITFLKDINLKRKNASNSLVASDVLLATHDFIACAFCIFHNVSVIFQNGGIFYVFKRSDTQLDPKVVNGMTQQFSDEVVAKILTNMKLSI